MSRSFQRTVDLDFESRRGSRRSVSLDVSLEFGLNLSATGEMEPDTARRVAHMLLYYADVLEDERKRA